MIDIKLINSAENYYHKNSEKIEPKQTWASDNDMKNVEIGMENYDKWYVQVTYLKNHGNNNITTHKTFASAYIHYVHETNINPERYFF